MYTHLEYSKYTRHKTWFFFEIPPGISAVGFIDKFYD